MKNVLVIYYSQSGQLKEIAEQIASPFLSESQIQLDFFKIEMQNEFPFPWSKETFIGAFPDTFLQHSHPIKSPPQDVLLKKYDLILLAYQPWYLSPSIPVNSFLTSQYAQKIFANTPVVTIIGSRNMWFMAQEKVKKLLKNINANLVGNIALADRNPNLISAYTIVKWMFTGEKRKFGIFPKPGIAQHEIDQASKFGQIILKHLNSNSFESLQEDLLKSDAVEICHFLIQIDKTANRMFSKWASIISEKDGTSRKRWLNGFYYYLVIAIWVLSPVVNLVYWLTYPFRYKKIKKEILYFKGV